MNLQLKKSSPFIKLANKIYNCKNVKSNRFVNESEMQNASPGPKIFSFQTKNQVSDKCGKTDLFERILSANGEERFRRRNIQPIADSPTKFKRLWLLQDL